MILPMAMLKIIGQPNETRILLYCVYSYILLAFKDVSWLYTILVKILEKILNLFHIKINFYIILKYAQIIANF